MDEKLQEIGNAFEDEQNQLKAAEGLGWFNISLLPAMITNLILWFALGRHLFCHDSQHAVKLNFISFSLH